MAAANGSWRAIDDGGVVVTVKPERSEVIGVISSAGTVELPIVVEVLREDGTVDEILTYPRSADVPS